MTSTPMTYEFMHGNSFDLRARPIARIPALTTADWPNRGSGFSAFEFERQLFPNLACALRGGRRQHSPLRRRQMPERDFRIRENELPEERGPYGSLIGGQIADREQRVQQCAVRSAIVGSGVPPVVHQHVEWRQRFDVMPPPVGNEQRVARGQFSL